MPRFNLYNRARVERQGGTELLERMAAKERGGENFITGRKYEFMYASYRLLEMAARRFGLEDSYHDVEPFDISECLECLIDDLMIREGGSTTYFQLKSGSVSEKALLASDFRAQQKLDAAHGRFASYCIVATPQYRVQLDNWLKAEELRCELIVFPKADGILALFDEVKGLTDILRGLSNSARTNTWLVLHRQVLGIWLETGDDSVDSIFYRLINEMRHLRPSTVNDRARAANLRELLSAFEFDVYWEGAAALFLKASIEDATWSCVVPCTTELLDAFDDWYNDQGDLSQGDLMHWFAASLERNC